MNFDSAREDIRRTLVRMQAMRKAIERQAFGDEEHHEEVRHELALDQLARKDVPMQPRKRRGRINLAFKKWWGR